MMSVDASKQIGIFLKANNITIAEVMGGEFFLNPNWQEILHNISLNMDLIRLVTNGDWAAEKTEAEKVIKFLKEHDQFYVGLSKDKWHTNKNVNEASKLLEEANILYRIPTGSEVTNDTLVPVGRAESEYNFYSFVGTYCNNPEKKYNFLIDENGKIYKCGFSVWEYDNIEKFLDGGFNERFKEFNTKFYNVFIGNCARCNNAWRQAKWDKSNGGK